MPAGAAELFAPEPAGVSDKQHLYVFVFKSPDGKKEHVKVGKTTDVNRRLKDVRTALLQAGRHKKWSVVCQRAELLAGIHEEQIHARLRGIARSQAKGYPSFSTGLPQGESREVYNLPYVQVTKVVSEVLYDHWAAAQKPAEVRPAAGLGVYRPSGKGF